MSKPWPAEGRAPNRSNTGVIIASMLTASTTAYVLFVFHAPLVAAAGSVVSDLSAKPIWALAIVAAGTLVAAVSFSIVALAAIARGVKSAPYTWCAPMLAVLSGIGMTQFQTQLPVVGIPPYPFAIGSSLFMLIGGALLQLRGAAVKLSGGGLLVAPLASAVIERCVDAGPLSASWRALGNQEYASLLVLSLTCLVMGLLSMATRTSGERQAEDTNAAQQWEARAMRGERKLAEAQLRAKSAERALGIFAPPNMVRAQLVLGSATLILTAILAGVYTKVYQPLVQQVRAQQVMLEEATAAQQTAVELARADLQAELVKLKTMLANERTERNALEAAQPVNLTAVSVAGAPVQNWLTTGAGTGTGTGKPAAKSAPARKVSKKVTPRVTERATRKAAIKARVLEARRLAAAARAERAPSNQVPGADHIDDDPIGGLGL